MTFSVLQRKIGRGVEGIILFLEEIAICFLFLYFNNSFNVVLFNYYDHLLKNSLIKTLMIIIINDI